MGDGIYEYRWSGTPDRSSEGTSPAPTAPSASPAPPAPSVPQPPSSAPQTPTSAPARPQQVYRNPRSTTRQQTVTIPSVFVPSNRVHRANRNPANTHVLAQFQSQRRQFVIKVYFLAVIFVLFTVTQWFLAIVLPQFEDLYRANNVITLLGMLCTFMLLSVFICVDQMRYNKPCNFLFALMIVESATFGLMRSLLHSNVGQFIFCCVASALLFATFVHIGLVLPRDLTMDILIMNIASFVFYFIVTLIIVMVLLTNAYFPDILFACVLMLLLMVYVMYNAQIISGTRIGALRWNEYILGALLLYFNFIVLLAMSLFMTGTLWWYDDTAPVDEKWPMEEESRRGKNK